MIISTKKKKLKIKTLRSVTFISNYKECIIPNGRLRKFVATGSDSFILLSHSFELIIKKKKKRKHPPYIPYNWMKNTTQKPDQIPQYITFYNFLLFISKFHGVTNEIKTNKQTKISIYRITLPHNIRQRRRTSRDSSMRCGNLANEVDDGTQPRAIALQFSIASAASSVLFFPPLYASCANWK